MASPRKRLLLVSRGPTKSITTWSGITWHARTELEKDFDVVSIDWYSRIVHAVEYRLMRLVSWGSQRFLKKDVRFLSSDTLPNAWLNGLVIWIAAILLRADFVFGTSCANYVAYVPGRIKVFHMTGTTFRALRDAEHYLDYSQCPRFMIGHYEAIERAAARRCCGFFLPAEHGAASLNENYGIPRERIAVVGYGAGLPRPVIDRHRKPSYTEQTCRLTFIGFDWTRKGGPEVVDVASRLHQAGVPVELHIVGPPTNPVGETPFDVQFHGRIVKDEELDRFLDLLSNSFTLLVLSKAEAFGVVFVEASALSVPSIAYDVGGVGNALLDGRTGRLLHPDTGLDEVASHIERMWRERPAYDVFRAQVGQHYDRDLSWERWRKVVSERIASTV